MGAIIGYFRYITGLVVLFGIIPEYIAIWLLWRGLSLPLPSWVYQRGDDKLYALYQRLVLFFFETCTGVQIVLYGDSLDILKKRENILYVANHQTNVDWVIAEMIALRGNSVGNLRYVMNDNLQFIPLCGQYFYAHGCIYVKRGKFNQEKMIKSLDYLNTDKFNTWLIIFPEGENYYPSTPMLQENNQQYARENNLPVLKHHLVPRVKGTWLCVQQLYNEFDAMYDVSMFYEGSVDEDGRRINAPSFKDFLTGKCKRVHIALRRIPMKDIPRDRDDLKAWLHRQFVEKDKIMDNFLGGTFESRETAQQRLNGQPNSSSVWSTVPFALIFFGLTIPFIWTSIGQMLYLLSLFYGTLGSYGWLAIRSVC